MKSFVQKSVRAITVLLFISGYLFCGAGVVVCIWLLYVGGGFVAELLRLSRSWGIGFALIGFLLLAGGMKRLTTHEKLSLLLYAGIIWLIILLVFGIVWMFNLPGPLWKSLMLLAAIPSGPLLLVSAWLLDPGDR